MKYKLSVVSCRMALLLSALLFSTRTQALVVGPYTPDANTVFLFHLDEPANSFIATNAAGSLAAGTNAYAFATRGNVYPGDNINADTNLTILGSSGAGSFAFGSFGNGANVAGPGITNGIGVDLKNNNNGYSLGDGSPSLDGDTLANQNLILGANKSFTVETLVNLAVTNIVNREIICADNTEATRGFQFRFTGPMIEFNANPGVNAAANDYLVAIPASGPHAFVAGAWFHIALTHTEVPVIGGTNTVIYWTRVSDTFTNANAINTNTAATIGATVPLVLVIGNEGRSAGGSVGSQEALQGSVDEVRISNTARPASGMMFSDGSITIAQQPVNATVASGATATFTVTASSPISSWAPLGYQWYSNSVPLVNAGDFSGVSTNKLVIANVQAAYVTAYYCVITNLYQTNTSSTASLAIHNPLTLAWRGTVNSNWDNAAATNWFDTGSSLNTNFFSSDNATFDDTGTGNPVNLTNSVQPGSVTVSASTLNYVFSGSGKITGLTGLAKSNGGTLTIQTTNDYTGVTTVNGGTVSVGQLANGGGASGIGAAPAASANLILNGGALQYTGPTVSINRGATINPNGGTVNVSTAGNTLTLGGTIAGTGGGALTKSGNGTLALSSANTYDGPTTVTAGTLQLTGSGSFGGGSVTNNSALLFSGSPTVNNNIAGTGVLTNDTTGTLTLGGNSTYSGNTTISGGLILASSTALGNSPLVTVNSTTGGALGGTRVTLNSGVSVPAGTALSLPSVSTTVRSLLYAAGTSAWGGPITLIGDGNTGNTIAFAGVSLLTITGNINAPVYNGTLQLRGDGSGSSGIGGGTIAGTLTVSNTAVVQVNDGVTWTISSTGNTWGTAQAATGVLKVGANNALPIASSVLLGGGGVGGNGTLDLAGFNQQIAGLATTGNAAIQNVTNSSGSTDSTLTFNSAGSSTYSGFIVDGALRKVALTVSGGTLTLGAADTYSGNTTISGGTLALNATGSIANSPNLSVAGGAKLDVSAATFTLGSSQTLAGTGATGTINGSANLGSGSLALNYTSGSPTLTETNGTLTLNNNAVTITVAGSPLPVGNYKLISAGTGGTVAGSVTSSPLTVNGAGVVAGHASLLGIIGNELYLVVTNHAPAASTITVTRNAGSSLKILLSDLSTNWSDADGDAISFVSVNNSTNGATVTTNGGFVLYPNAPNVNDQFSYTITDSLGATASGLVNLTVTTNSTGQINSFAVTGGTASMNFAGIPGYTYNVDRSTDLVSWSTIWTTNAPSNGVFDFTDSPAPQPSAYYRLSWTP